MFKKIESSVIKSLLFVIFVRIATIAGFVYFVAKDWAIEKFQGFSPITLSLSDGDMGKYNQMNTYSFFFVASIFLLIFTYKFAKWRKYNLSIVHNWFASTIITQVAAAFIFVPGLLFSIGENFELTNNVLMKISGIYLAFTVFLYIWANISNKLFNKKEAINKANFDFQAENGVKEEFTSHYKSDSSAKKQTPPPRPGTCDNSQKNQSQQEAPKPKPRPVKVRAEVVDLNSKPKAKKSFFSSFKKTKFSQSGILAESKKSSIRISGLKGGSVLDKLD